MFLGMKNAKEGGCSSDFVHILNVIFFQTLSWPFSKLSFFCGKILKNHKCMYYWFWYFTKSWCQLWYWYFWNHQFWYLFKKPLNIFHWYHSLTLSAVSHALACERIDQCSVLRQWGERVGSIRSNSSNRFCPAEEDAIKIGESIRRWRGIRPTIVYQLPSEGIFVTKETKGC